MAGVDRLQRKQLWPGNNDHGAIGCLPVADPNRPDHGSKEAYTKVREQARVQVACRKSGRPVHEVLKLLMSTDFPCCQRPHPETFSLTWKETHLLVSEDEITSSASPGKIRQVGRPTSAAGR